MEIERADGRTVYQLRPLACSWNVLNQAHGSSSWSQGDLLAPVYGPKAGTKKNESPEKACIEVIWRTRTLQNGKAEKEYEMILKRTLQNADIPLKHLAVAICCSVTDDGEVMLDPTKLEEQNMKAFAYLVFRNATMSVHTDGTTLTDSER